MKTEMEQTLCKSYGDLYITSDNKHFPPKILELIVAGDLGYLKELLYRKRQKLEICNDTEKESIQPDIDWLVYAIYRTEVNLAVDHNRKRAGME